MKTNQFEQMKLRNETPFQYDLFLDLIDVQELLFSFLHYEELFLEIPFL